MKSTLTKGTVLPAAGTHSLREQLKAITDRSHTPDCIEKRVLLANCHSLSLVEPVSLAVAMHALLARYRHSELRSRCCCCTTRSADLPYCEPGQVCGVSAQRLTLSKLVKLCVLCA